MTIDVSDSGRHSGQFDFVWPELEPALVEAMDAVRGQISEITVHARAHKAPGYLFQAHVAFTAASGPNSPDGAKEIDIVVTCGAYFNIRTDSNLLLMRIE